MGAVAVSFGLLHGPEVGLGTGLAGGLLMDLLNSRFIGLCALTRGGMGVAAGLLGKRVFKENLLVTGTVGFVAAFGSELLGAVVIRASGVALDVAAFLGTALAVGLLNFVATPLLFYILWRDKVRVDSRDSAVIVE
jgi:rod shape-determining protein MreD